MSNGNNLQNDPDQARRMASSREKILSFFPNPPDRWMFVDSENQRLSLMRETGEMLTWPVSTAAVGLDGRQDSGGTPPGLHLIHDRIGDGMPSGMVFKDRAPTGIVWSPGSPGRPESDPDSPDDLILTRILTLAGMEKGLNRGPGCDSLKRYIYIHGTNHEAEIGRPVSHGCIRMGNAHLLELFDLVDKGDPVVIL